MIILFFVEQGDLTEYTGARILNKLRLHLFAFAPVRIEGV